MAKKQVTKTKTKIAYGKRLFAELTNKQAGRDFSIMHLILDNMYKDLSSEVFEDKKLATDTFIKIMPYVLPRESNGSAFNLQINNNNGGKVKPEQIAKSLDEFMSDRVAEIMDVKNRVEAKGKIRLKEIGIVEDKEDE